MIIVHKLGKQALKKEGEGSFLLTDRRGGFLSLSDSNKTHMQGFFSLDSHWNMYKFIEDFELEIPVTEIHNCFSHAKRIRSKSIETFYLTNTALIYEIKNYSGKIFFNLDFRSMYDFDDQNRIYQFERFEDMVIVFYPKNKKYLVIKGDSNFHVLNEWTKRVYPYDELRGSKSNFYVNKAFFIECSENKKFYISYSDSKEEAIDKVRSAQKNELLLKEALNSAVPVIKPGESFALGCAAHSLNGLRTIIGKGNNKGEGVFAGLPWFFQFWSRDELISLKAFMLQGKFGFAKKRLDYYLANINDVGRLPNRVPGSSLSSADSVFWLFKRYYDLIILLDKKGRTNEFFSKKQLEVLKHKLHFTIEEQSINFMKNYLLYSGSKETWMDTFAFGQNGREGFCIEIQALFLSSFKLMKLLCQKLDISYYGYNHLEKLLSKKVKNSFYKDGLLYDTLDDSTARPNIFLAYYVYPELLSKMQWKMIFDKILTKIWLDWGGLSSIAKDSKFFQPKYTGENNLSYHNGDSWYWINSLAAICMHSLDEKKYSYQVESILRSSEDEILSSGFIGHSAEISSASSRLSQGCLSQAWSSAMFIELCHLLGENHKPE